MIRTIIMELLIALLENWLHEWCDTVVRQRLNEKRRNELDYYMSEV